MLSDDFSVEKETEQLYFNDVLYFKGVGTVKPLTITVPTDTDVSDKYEFLYSRFCKME